MSPNLNLHGHAEDEILNKLLTAKDVAAILGVSHKRVYELGIPCIRISSRSLRYQQSDVSAWLKRRKERLVWHRSSAARTSTWTFGGVVTVD